MEIMSLFDYFLPLIMYAETHYSFKGIYSRLKKNEPEIIADVPHRIEPKIPFPILILVKDANIYPVFLDEVEITVFARNKTLNQKRYCIKKYVTEKFWFQILEISTPSDFEGLVEINVAIRIKMNGKTRIYHNDNYRISSHAPFKSWRATEFLPGNENVVWGDIHYHSAFTADQVEFGAPLAATVKMAEALGCAFFAVTDHSYDLDDYEDNMLKNDPNLPKWKKLQAEVARLNSELNNFCIIPGEEVSAGNWRNKNVHFLILNDPQFYPGMGDGAERWFRNKPDLAVSHILEQLNPNALAFAAHPEVDPPWLQKLLIRRGKWEKQDYENARLNGMQIWNGKDDRFFEAGLATWKQHLLAGRRMIIVAGNDAHGNFNRFRQIGFPFWTLRENTNEIFGYARTGVLLDGKFSLEAILSALRKGACVISNGPLLTCEIPPKWKIGDTFIGHDFQLAIKATSTREYGKLNSLKIWLGNSEIGEESLLFDLTQFSKKYQFEKIVSVRNVPPAGYIRGELQTHKEGRYFRCYTNPVWIKNKKYPLNKAGKKSNYYFLATDTHG